MSNKKYKPLSFSTTMRNPDRIAGFLECLLPFENELLTNEIIKKIVRIIIYNKLYRPNYISRNHILSDIYSSEDNFFSDEQLDEIISCSPQKHKEAGFDEGWPSRFDTWFKLAKEFGFVNYSINNRIEISETGHLLIEAHSKLPADDQMIQNVFLNALAKYQTNNPFRKNKSDNVPLVLLLQVLKRMHEEDSDCSGIFRSELSFFICWPDNDYEKLYKKIKDFRLHHRFSEYTDEIIYEECLRIMGYSSDDKKYIKMEKVTEEAVDEYIRKMRSTGIVSLRGNARFIDLNRLENKKIDYILENYSNYRHYTDCEEYFIYMGKTDSKLMALRTGKIPYENEIRKKTLVTFAQKHDREYIINEINNVCKKKESKDPVFRLINEPVRFEFLVSIALVQNYKELDVNPNYTVDDEGLPSCTAPGGVADIVCYDKKYKGLVEVTLMCGRQQVNNEMLPISRHLADSVKEQKESLAIFIAPHIHDDVVRYTRFIKHDESLIILPYGINEFFDILKNYETFDDLAAHE